MSLPGSPLTPVVDSKLESTLDSVDRAEEMVVAQAEKVGLSEEETFRLGYAVREAMVNAVVHGNHYSANKSVHFQVLRSDTGVEVRIRDEGAGYVPDPQVNPLAEENLLNQSGRGLTLIRAFVDNFEVGPAPEGGTLAVLRKSVAPPLPDAGSGGNS